MFKRINNWHLSALVAIVSIVSIVLVQQYVEAQGWQDPGALPGGTPANNLVVNPMIENLQLGGRDVAGTGIRVSDTGLTAIEVNNRDINITGTGRLCFDDSDCESAWPTIAPGGGKWDDSVNPGDIYYTGGNVGIGINTPSYPLEVAGDISTGYFAEGDSGATASVGDRLFFNGTIANSDYLWISRFNLNSDSTELRVGIGDNADENDPVSYMDKFIVGATDTNQSGAGGAGEYYDGDKWVPRFTVTSQGRVGIGNTDPGYALHVVDDNSTGVLNIDNEGPHLWTGTRLERDNIEKWFIGMNDTDDKLIFRANNSIDSIDSMILDSNNVDTALNLQGDDTSFFTVSVIDSWDDNVSNAGINFSRNAWKTDVYTDYTMSIKYGNFSLESYYTKPVGAGGDFLSATPLFIKDIGAASGGGPTAGYVGINTTDPQAQLQVNGGITAYGTTAGESNLKLQNDSGDMKIIFQEYDPPLTSNGDMSIRFNGNNPSINDGYANWLEFWGRDPSDAGGRPIMTMQRDYESAKTNYLGVGIGVPALTNIDAKLRVQSFGSEDILQLYDNNTEVFTVADGGKTTVNGELGVVSADDGVNKYIQLDVTSSYPPPTVDCDSASEVGRMIWMLGYNKLFICSQTGWLYEQF